MVRIRRRISNLHGPPQGWASNTIGDDFYWAFFWSYWFIPFALLLLLHKEYRVFAISSAPAIETTEREQLRRSVTWPGCSAPVGKLVHQPVLVRT